MNDITLKYAGISIKHTITRDDVAGYVASRLAPKEHEVEFFNQIRDALALIDVAYNLQTRFGFKQLFGTSTDFQSYLLDKMKKGNSHE